MGINQQANQCVLSLDQHALDYVWLKGLHLLLANERRLILANGCNEHRLTGLLVNTTSFSMKPTYILVLAKKFNRPRVYALP